MCPAAAVARNSGHGHVHDREQPNVALQVAGNDSDELAAAAARAGKMGFAQVNLNCGCHSAKVTAGGFGACQMASPATVARHVAAMVEATDLPVSVKCRIGLKGHEPEDRLDEFAAAVAQAGATSLVVHCRLAWLGGLNPKQNRSRPPLSPERAVELKRNFPRLEIISNGGITSVTDARQRLRGVDGVMLGRSVVERPLLLAQLGEAFHGQTPAPIEEVLAGYLGYCASQLAQGEHPRRLLAPLGALARGRIGGRQFRRAVNEASSTGDLESLRRAWA